jgi:hypothetical protein
MDTRASIDAFADKMKTMGDMPTYRRLVTEEAALATLPRSATPEERSQVKEEAGAREFGLAVQAAASLNSVEGRSADAEGEGGDGSGVNNKQGSWNRDGEDPQGTADNG